MGVSTFPQQSRVTCLHMSAVQRRYGNRKKYGNPRVDINALVVTRDRFYRNSWLTATCVIDGAVHGRSLQRQRS